MSDADEPTKQEHEDRETFASRWSRRKQEVAARSEQVTPPTGNVESSPGEPAKPLAAIVSDGSVGRMQTRTEADRLAEQQSAGMETPPVQTDADMPPVESLDENSDFSGFMSPGVSDKLRKMALRKLFAGAGFNIRDGLDDYDDDFTSFEGLGDLVTCDMKHRAEMEAARKTEAEREEGESLAHAGEQCEESELDEDAIIEGDQERELGEERVAGLTEEQAPPDEGAGVEQEQRADPADARPAEQKKTT